MKIKVLRGCCASGKALARGKTYSVSDEDAEVIIRSGKAAPASAKKPAKKKSKK